MKLDYAPTPICDLCEKKITAPGYCTFSGFKIHWDCVRAIVEEKMAEKVVVA